MGFSWAPVIAQAAASSFSKFVLSRAPWVAVHLVYIDNLTFGLTAEHAHRLEELHDIVRVAAAEWKVVIKPSSIEKGPTFRWRGLDIDLTHRTFKFKHEFADKVSEAVSSAVVKEWRISVGDSLALAACAIYAAFVTARPLCRILHIMRFLSQLGTAMGQGHIDLHRIMRWPRDAAAAMQAEIPLLRQTWSRPARVPLSGKLYGVSDAAGPSDDRTPTIL
jgi:hypothetical protein